jgi:glycosyltransferase involved in cell wall biosynthesis
VIPSTPAYFIHDPLRPWIRPRRDMLAGRSVIWHTVWSDTYSNPRYAELLPRLRELFFAPIRHREGFRGRIDAAVSRRSRFIERRTLAWYRHAGVRLLLTYAAEQAFLFDGPVVVDLDDPTFDAREQAALRATNIRHVVVTTPQLADRVRASNPAVDVTVIPQGVDLERASSTRSERLRTAILARVGGTSNSVVVGYHAPVLCLSSETSFQGRRFETFHMDVLMSQAERLWSEGLSFALVLVGQPSPAVTELARGEKRLVLTGYIDRERLLDWVGTFDIGTYPRTVDFRGRQSVKLFEYMASGAAIVAMRTSETNFLDETGTGHSVVDSDEFGRLLRSLIVNRRERLALVERARAFVTNHDWRILSAHYDQVLESVIAAE